MPNHFNIYSRWDTARLFNIRLKYNEIQKPLPTVPRHIAPFTFFSFSLAAILNLEIT